MEPIKQERHVIIVAGGAGKRMGSRIPKQFMYIDGRPLLMISIESFFMFDPDINIVVVLPGKKVDYWRKLITRHNFGISHSIVSGGDSRYESVKNGLDVISNNGIVAVHDGVRPFIASEVIGKCFETARKFGNAVPVIEPFDSVRIRTGNEVVSVNRQQVMLVQTPQVFEVSLLKEAYDLGYDERFLDDATVVERTGKKIHYVEGNRKNIKITTKEDILTANAYSGEL